MGEQRGIHGIRRAKSTEDMILRGRCEIQGKLSFSSSMDQLRKQAYVLTPPVLIVGLEGALANVDSVIKKGKAKEVVRETLADG
jgi:hypothetical protein